ncbi:MAG: hypothetical protein AB1757_06710 [Acidobacteriota bacterium]
MTELAKPKQTEIAIPLKDLVYAYIEAGNKVSKFEEKAKPFKDAKEAIKTKIIELFKSRGEFSSRIEGATVSLSVRKTAVIVDEVKVVEQLKEAGLTDYISERVNDLFEQPKKKIAAGEEPLLEGMIIKETEFISVRKNEKDEPRKVVTSDFKKVEGS